MTSRIFGHVRKSLAGAIVLAALGVASAAAQDAKNLGTFNYWTAWQGNDANGVICYISSAPQDMQPTSLDHGDNHFLVIHRKGLGTRNEVQALLGYSLKEGSVPTVSVDGKSYNMVFEGKAAWLASASDEPGFVDAMKRGAKMVVKATSAKGNNTSYTYSLSGVTAAMKAIDEACS